MSEEQTQHVEAVTVTANALEQIERAGIDIQIATAHKYPKHGDKEQRTLVKKEMMGFATLDEETAAACFYSLPRGNKVIQGPSIRMAEIAVSCYGNIRNCVRTIEVVDRGPTPHVVVQAVCHDLERNVAVSIEKRRRITKKKKNQFIDEDDITLAVNAGASIAFRDAAFKVIPQALIKPVWEAAKKVAIGDIRSIVETRSKCIERLNKMGVTIDRILSVLECNDIEDIMQPQLAVLFGLGTAVKDGDCTLEEAFPKPQAEQKEGSTAADNIKNKFDKEPEKTEKPDNKKKGRGKGKGKKKDEPKPEAKTDETKLVKCPLCSELVDPAVPHTCEVDSGEPEQTEKPEEHTTEQKDEVLPDKYKCMRCDHLLKDKPEDVSADGTCAHCFGKIAELS